MTGVEIDMVVSDSKKALAQYAKIFEVEHSKATSFEKGLNEAAFSIYGACFHLLDENPEYELYAPKPGSANPFWCNIVVPNIKEVFQKALAAGCVEIQPVTEIPQMGVSNAMFADSFGYTWLLHQVHREVGFEERCRVMEEMN